MDEVPVLVGVGEVTIVGNGGEQSLSPLELATAAAERALVDCSPSLRGAVDTVKVVNISSWDYDDPAGDLARRLGLGPVRGEYGEVGGQTPVEMIHRAALAIAGGESRAVLVCGAEAQYSVARASRDGAQIPWPQAGVPRQRLDGRNIVHPLAARAGLSTPASVYPLYEVAMAAGEGKSIDEAQAESARLYAAFSRIAAANPTAWRARGFEASEIAQATADNRMVAWPYTKRMVANPLVDMASAVIVTSLGAAQAAGVAPARMVFVTGGAAASEPRDFIQRDQFARSHAQDAVLDAAAGLAPGGFDHLELYSCFPCVPKLAARSLGLGERADLTVTGGLSFFGAPLSNYMLHAAAGMVRRIRASGGRGLLYGQGEFVTKHHALVLSGNQPDGALARDYCVQSEADARRGLAPQVAEPIAGAARIETGTVLYRRDGSTRHAALVLRMADGRRTVATVPAHDGRTLATLTEPTSNPVGLLGEIAVEARDGEPEATWSMA